VNWPWLLLRTFTSFCFERLRQERQAFARLVVEHVRQYVDILLARGFEEGIRQGLASAVYSSPGEEPSAPAYRNQTDAELALATEAALAGPKELH
jgi:hypothetical protein